MDSKRKYLFFDIDGTLTDRATGEIVPSAKKALEMLEANGHFVAIATGRAHYKAIGFMKENDLANMVCNGGNGIVKDGVLVENAPLDYEKSVAICRQADELGYGVLIAPKDSDDCCGKDDLFREQVGPRKEPTTYHIDPKYQFDSFEDIYKIYISIPKEKEELLTLKDTLGNLRFQPEYLMFQPDDKKGGILRMMQILGANPADVVVFGDDYNDMDMFSGDWYSIAMGNACGALKEMASEVTERNVDDGIYNACRRHGWI